eukprot:SAG31_NODE_3677_length_3996_cov_5.686939_5_plen_32_part_00
MNHVHDGRIGRGDPAAAGRSGARMGARGSAS